MSVKRPYNRNDFLAAVESISLEGRYQRNSEIEMKTATRLGLLTEEFLKIRLKDKATTIFRNDIDWAVKELRKTGVILPATGFGIVIPSKSENEKYYKWIEAAENIRGAFGLNTLSSITENVSDNEGVDYQEVYPFLSKLYEETAL